MSKREDELLIASLTNRWSTRSAPAAGTTAVCNVAIEGPKAKQSITSFSYSVNNAKGAAAVTVTGQISDASIGGTVLADWDFVVAAAAAVQGTFANLDIPGLRGSPLVFSMTPPNASATMKVAAAGWTDQMVNG